MAAERAVREAQATLLAAADIDRQPAELQVWECQNWKGAILGSCFSPQNEKTSTQRSSHQKQLNGGHLQWLSGLVRASGSDDDAGLNRILLIAAWATSAELESSVYLLWLVQETSETKKEYWEDNHF